MQVWVCGDEELACLTVAGRTVRARVEDAFAGLGIGGIRVFTSPEAAMAEVHAGASLFLMRGWFPFLDRLSVETVVSRGRTLNEVVRVVRPGKPGHFLAWFPAKGVSRPDIFFSGSQGPENDDIPLDPLVLQVLASAVDYPIMCDYAFELNRRRAMEAGAFLVQPETVCLDDDVRVHAGAWIGGGVHLEGRTVIHAQARVDVGSVVRDSIIHSGAQIKPYCVLQDCEVGEEAQVGPFAHVRPGSRLGRRVKVGNFVETKKANLHDDVKASHLSYLGDVEVGEDSNIGAGTITCNYDGFSKHKTVLGRRVFIGSDTQLVAPVSLGDDAYVAAGSCVTQDVAAGDLAISRCRQSNKAGFGLRLRERARKAAREES